MDLLDIFVQDNAYYIKNGERILTLDGHIVFSSCP